MFKYFQRIYIHIFSLYWLMISNASNAAVKYKSRVGEHFSSDKHLSCVGKSTWKRAAQLDEQNHGNNETTVYTWA